jgi:hypothetical protein
MAYQLSIPYTMDDCRETSTYMVVFKGWFREAIAPSKVFKGVTFLQLFKIKTNRFFLRFVFSKEKYL